MCVCVLNSYINTINKAPNSCNLRGRANATYEWYTKGFAKLLTKGSALEKPSQQHNNEKRLGKQSANSKITSGHCYCWQLQLSKLSLERDKLRPSHTQRPPEHTDWDDPWWSNVDWITALTLTSDVCRRNRFQLSVDSDYCTRANGYARLHTARFMLTKKFR